MPLDKLVTPAGLRAAFARSLSSMYGGEVPAYTTLVQVTEQVNTEVLEREGSAAQRLGDTARVTAERHGAIRVGSAVELAQVGRLFAAMGMQAVGVYDLREVSDGSTALPIVSTAFRPIDADELAANPFRVFTSVLVPEDRRFFDADLGTRVQRFVSARTLFPPELLALADAACARGGLGDVEADRFLALATAAFALSPDPIDAGWYAELSAVSGVAADIAGVTSTHINHLTPRVLDIDLLYDRMSRRGVEMIEEIQGPPRWSGPAVLLRQTSFRALSEPRAMRSASGVVEPGELRVRFGEVEARGIALTPAGREVVDPLLAAGAGAAEWAAALPATEEGWDAAGLAWFRSVRAPDGSAAREPVVYEDFLPRSAAGIFRSNLADQPSVSAEGVSGVVRDVGWFADAMDREVHYPMALYAEQASR